MNEHDDVRGLLPAWALDAVDDAERARIERAIHDDPELAAEAADLRDTAAGLALGSATIPPPELRARVLDAVAGAAQEDAVADAPQADAGGEVPHPAESRRSAEGREPRVPPQVPADESATGGRTPARPSASRRRPWARWALAAAFLVAAAVPGTIAVQQYQRAERAETQVAELAEVVVRPGAELVRADVAGGGEAVAVVTGDEAVFLAGNLPELDDERDYQLWVIEEDGIMSAGVLATDDGRTDAEVSGLGDGSVLGVTVEPAGGSPQPTSDPIVTLAAG